MRIYPFDAAANDNIRKYRQNLIGVNDGWYGWQTVYVVEL
jgi:hypothetical protein